MAKIGELYVAITGDNSSLKSSLNDSSNQTKKFTSETTIGLAKMATGWLSVGAAISKVWEETNKLSKTTASVAAATGASAKEMEAFTEAAYGMADMGVSADQAMQAIEALAKAGISTSDILGGALQGALTLAAAGSTDVGFAAETAASAMTQFGLSGTDVTHVADLLAAGAGKAQGEVSDMAMALSQAGLVSAQAGLSIEETVGSLTAMASAGLLGSDAGTSFRNMLLRLTPSSKEAADQMKELGISAFDSSGQFVGMAEYAGRLQKALAGMSAEQKQAALVTMFGTDSIRAANILITQGEKGMTKWIDTVNQSGYAQDVATKKLESLNGEFTKTVSSVNNSAAKLGGELAPALIASMEAVQGLTIVFDGIVGVIGDVFDGINNLTGGLGGTAIAAVAAGVALTAAFGPIGLLVGGISLAVGMVAKGINDNAKAQDELNKKIKQGTEYLYEYTIAGALAEKRSMQKAQAEIAAAKEAAAGVKKANTEALDKIMQEYRDAQKTKLQLINEEESATIAKAKKEGATAKDISVINQYYAKQRKELLDEEAEYYKEIQDATVEAHEIARKKREETDAAAAQVVIDGIEAEKTWNQELEDATTEAHDIALANKEATDSAAAAAEIARIEATKQAEAKAFADRVALWSSFSGTVVSQIATISEATGAFFAGEESGWRGLANTAIKAIAGIVRALAHELEVKAAKALAEAVALSLGLNPAAIPKYAEAGGYALGVSGIYAGAGAIEALANFGAGTSAVPQSGSYLVGEYGPEMVTLPKGASVQTNAVTSANMGSTYNVTNVFNSPKAISAVEADRLSRKAMREQRAFA